MNRRTFNKLASPRSLGALTGTQGLEAQTNSPVLRSKSNEIDPIDFNDRVGFVPIFGCKSNPPCSVIVIM